MDTNVGTENPNGRGDLGDRTERTITFKMHHKEIRCEDVKCTQAARDGVQW